MTSVLCDLHYADTAINLYDNIIPDRENIALGLQDTCVVCKNLREERYQPDYYERIEDDRFQDQKGFTHETSSKKRASLQSREERL